MPVVDTTTIESISSGLRRARSECLARRPLQQIERRIEIDAVTLGPIVKIFVPLDRYRRVATIDARVAEHRKQPHDLSRTRAEREIDASNYLSLPQRVRRDGGSHR